SSWVPAGGDAAIALTRDAGALAPSVVPPSSAGSSRGSPVVSPSTSVISSGSAAPLIATTISYTPFTCALLITWLWVVRHHASWFLGVLGASATTAIYIGCLPNERAVLESARMGAGHCIPRQSSRDAR